MSVLTTILNDIRLMKRNINLRKENDPNKVIHALEAVLKEVILVRGVDQDSSIARGALEELANLRNALITRHIDAGHKQGEMLAKFTMVLSELQQAREMVDSESKERSDDNEGEGTDYLKSAFSRVTENLPSAQSITSALITANPLMGYGAKMILDLTRSRREHSARAKEEAMRRKHILQAQAEEIQRRLENINEEKDLLVEQDPEIHILGDDQDPESVNVNILNDEDIDDDSGLDVDFTALEDAIDDLRVDAKDQHKEITRHNQITHRLLADIANKEADNIIVKEIHSSEVKVFEKESSETNNSISDKETSLIENNSDSVTNNIKEVSLIENNSDKSEFISEKINEKETSLIENNSDSSKEVFQIENNNNEFESSTSEWQLIERETNNNTFSDECDIDCFDVSELEILLEEIKREMIELNAVWHDDSYKDKEQTNELITVVEDAKVNLNDIAKEAKVTNRFGELRRREEEVAARSEFLKNQDKEDQPTVIHDQAKSGLGLNFIGGFGGLGKLGAATGIGAVLGTAMGALMNPLRTIITGLTSIAGFILSPLRSIISIFGALKTPLLALGKLAKGAGIVSAIFGVIDFFNFFFKADDLLGKLSSETSWGERILMGISGFVVGFVDAILQPIEWVLNKIGSWNILPDWLSSWLENVDLISEDKAGMVLSLYNGISRIIDVVSDSVSMAWDGIQSMYTSTVTWIQNTIADVTNFFTVTIPAFGEALKAAPGQIKTKILDMISDLGEKIKETVMSIFDLFKEGIINKFTEAKNWALGLVGLGPKESRSQEETNQYVHSLLESITESSKTVTEVLSQQTEALGFNNVYRNPLFDQLQEASQLRIMNRPDTQTERRLNQMEQTINRTVNNTSINLTPVSNQSMTNVNNNTIRPSLSSPNNNEPAYRRFSAGSSALIYR